VVSSFGLAVAEPAPAPAVLAVAPVVAELEPVVVPVVSLDDPQPAISTSAQHASSAERALGIGLLTLA